MKSHPINPIKIYDYKDVFLDSARTIDHARPQDPIIVTSGGVKKKKEEGESSEEFENDTRSIYDTA